MNGIGALAGLEQEQWTLDRTRWNREQDIAAIARAMYVNNPDSGAELALARAELFVNYVEEWRRKRLADWRRGREAAK